MAAGLRSKSEHSELLLGLNALKKDILIDQVYGEKTMRHPQIQSVQKLDLNADLESFFSELKNSIAAITDLSGLVLDGDLSSHSLMEAFVILYPSLLKLQDKLTPDRKAKSPLNKSQIRKDFVETFTELRNSVEKSLIYSSIQNDEKKKLARVVTDLDAFINDPPQLIREFEARDWELVESGLAVLRGKLEKRYQIIHFDWKTEMGKTTLLMIVSLFLSITIFIFLRKKQLQIQNELLDKQLAIERGFRLTTVGEVFASIAHDIASPLQVIRMSVEQAKAQFTKTLDQTSNVMVIEKTRFCLDKIERMVEKSESILANMRALLLDNSSVAADRFTAQRVISDLKDLMELKLHKCSIQLEFKNETRSESMDTNYFAVIQILTNLINNAIDLIESTKGACFILSISKRTSPKSTAEANPSTGS